MAFLKSIALAFSCFSVLPMPQQEWNGRSMRYMLAVLPLVGLVSGALVLGWCLLADAVGFGGLLRAVGIALLPIGFSGGIHLDGFADVVDAQASHASRERKRQILKDPHIGAFAAMAVAAYLLLYTALASELPLGWQVALLLAGIQVAVRCESGLASVALSGAASGMLSAFRESAEKRTSLALLAAAYASAAAVMVAVLPLPAACALAGGLAALVALKPFAERNFGGMTGDVAGFFLQACELVMLACLVVGLKVVTP